MNKKNNLNYIEEMNDYFNANYEKHKCNVASLGWSKKSQEVRFEFFSDIISLDNKTILDIGSGFGDLAHYLQKKYPSVKYTGYDINEKFIENSKKGKNISFEHRNILENPPKEKFDVIFSIGALNTKFTENEKIMCNLIKTLFESCDELVAISMLSIYADKKYKDTKKMYYYNPEKIFAYAKTLTKKVSLHHEYLPHDFTIVLYKK